MAARPPPSKPGVGAAWPVLLAFVAIGVGVVGQVLLHPDQIGLPADATTQVADMPRDYGEDRAAAIAEAHAAVLAVLKDPDSAQFRADFVRNDKLPIVCGEVNARNGFGGFGGYSPYLVVGSMADVRGGGDDAAFVRNYNSLCIDHPRPTPHSHRVRHARRHPESPAQVAHAEAPPPAETLAPVTVETLGGDGTER